MLLNRHVQMALGMAVFAALVGTGKGVHANTLEVTATVPDSCTVGTGSSLAFGTVNIGPQSGDITGSGQINIDCNTASAASIELDEGLHDGAKGNGRAMKRSNSNNFLNYRLYTQGLSQLREPGTPVAVPGGLTAGPNAVVVEGVIDGQQTEPGGEYSDTVQITLTLN